MVKGLYTAYTGMVNEQRRMDVMTNNLANSATTGYKKEAMIAQAFDERLAIKIKDTSEWANRPTGIGYISMGAKIGETYTNWEQGPFQITDKDSDVALAGKGFFAIEFTNKAGETSIKYTRDGNFVVDNEGYLRTVDGDYVLTADGALGSQSGDGFRVQIDPNLKYAIAPDGTISQNNEPVTTIGVIDIQDYDYINKYGENLYDLIEGGTIIESEATVQQGMLETSNVNVVDEMVNMIQIARAYEAGQKMIQAEDSTLEKTANQIGRV
ncbi:flagellar basal-body rod protein FlgG [Pseudobutyrivibrio sp. YE44]|uniref:flagellar hook-basal body protein n=1 Tax=Pseudobutyrivibrio sp. YE44 TaxID=1520802 RepID=UPI000889093D|nr:flagellar hook-basal body protein [Pseudobutyrivibrio sp. YE44]SDB29559.1 flagellar basal-body rod protein FlgG [Pseudobutyrivibrio sp. YE44]